MPTNTTADRVHLITELQIALETCMDKARHFDAPNGNESHRDVWLDAAEVAILEAAEAIPGW